MMNKKLQVDVCVEFQEREIHLTIKGPHEAQDEFIDALKELWQENFFGTWKFLNMF